MKTKPVMKSLFSLLSITQFANQPSSLNFFSQAKCSSVRTTSLSTSSSLGGNILVEK